MLTGPRFEILIFHLQKKRAGFQISRPSPNPFRLLLQTKKLSTTVMSNPLIKSFCHQLNSPSFMDGGTHTINFYPPPLFIRNRVGYKNYSTYHCDKHSQPAIGIFSCQLQQPESGGEMANLITVQLAAESAKLQFSSLLNCFNFALFSFQKYDFELAAHNSFPFSPISINENFIYFYNSCRFLPSPFAL